QGDNPTAVVGGLYAIGECSCVSVHGANRLGTNSLLDLMVFGRSAGNHIIASEAHKRAHKPLPKDAAERSLARLAQLDASKTGDGSHVVADAIRTAMQTHCGVFRTDKLMSEGVQAIADIADQVDRIHLKDKSRVFNTARIEALEVDNLIEVAKATMVSAQARKESRGAHYHNDHTERDDQDWLKHTLWWREGSRLSYKPVQLKPLTVEPFKPKARTF
ncbi:MAG: fumarate reductase (quinol) flavoprotein subunit, partial [Thiomonas sp. 20-64-5]